MWKHAISNRNCMFLSIIIMLEFKWTLFILDPRSMLEILRPESTVGFRRAGITLEGQSAPRSAANPRRLDSREVSQ